MASPLKILHNKFGKTSMNWVLILKILYVLALMVRKLCQGAKEVYKCFYNTKLNKQIPYTHCLNYQ